MDMFLVESYRVAYPRIQYKYRNSITVTHKHLTWCLYIESPTFSLEHICHATLHS